MVVNTAFFPNLMWNSRFAALSDDPFDNSAGLLVSGAGGADALVPAAPARRASVHSADGAGRGGGVRLSRATTSTSATRCCDASTTSPEYRQLFGELFPSVRRRRPDHFDMFGRAIAEFEFTLTFADAPIDRFARGQQERPDRRSEARARLLFFGAARCVQCHAVSGPSNEMFSDFHAHVIGVPQIAPLVRQCAVRWARPERGLRAGADHRQPG